MEFFDSYQKIFGRNLFS